MRSTMYDPHAEAAEAVDTVEVVLAAVVAVPVVADADSLILVSGGGC